MATFSFRAAGLAGPVQSGTIEAETRAHAVLDLQRQGLRPIEIAEARAKGDGTAKAKTAPPAELAKAVSGLAVLVGAGLPLDRSLVIAIENAEHAALKQNFMALLARVKEGQPLSVAVTGLGRAFPPIMAPMVESGEANGRLADSLAKLGHTLERAAQLRRAVVSAMIYPCILVTVAVGVILMMLLFVMPQFESLFQQNADKLPGLTRMTLAASRFVREDGLLFLLGLVVGGFGLRLLLARPTVRRTIDRRMLALPRIGALVRRMETARFARVLAGLVGSGVPLPTALALARRSIGNGHMGATIDEIVVRVRQGAPLSPQFVAAGLFPRVAISFIRTGEETATLPAMLERLADTLDEEVSVSLDRLIGIITPLVTILMGVIIATLIASIMTAILGFNSFVLDD